jgi:hypothetical protein
MRVRNLGATALCLFASIAMVGDMLGSRNIKGLGAVSACAPFPRVFCEFEGMEGFACEFTVCFEVEGQEREQPITPELYASANRGRCGASSESPPTQRTSE